MEISIEIQVLDVSDRDRPWMTLEAAAKYLQKSERTIQRWIADGVIKPDKVGREYHIPVEVVKKLASG